LIDDVLPTIAAITGVLLPKENRIDGLDVSGRWLGKTKESSCEEFIHDTSRGDLKDCANSKLRKLAPAEVCLARWARRCT
jgi:hypothetical protein